MDRGTKVAAAAAGAVVTWFIGYKLATDHVLKSSSIVKQTIFNLQVSPLAQELLGNSIRLSSGVAGDMNQVKGFADLSFKCSGSKSNI